MSKYSIKDIDDNILWETSVKEYADEFAKLLKNEGVKYVITVQD